MLETGPRSKFTRVVAIGVALACALWLAPPALALPQPDATLAVFEERWRESARWSPSPGWVYRWRQEVFASRPPEELARRAAELANLPDHPERHELAADQARAEKGPTVIEVEVWWAGPGEVRANRTQTAAGEPATYTDFVLSDDAVFCLTPQQLTVLQPGAPEPPGRGFSTVAASTLMELQRFATGGMGGPEFPGFEPTGARPEGNGLVGFARNAQGHSLTIRAERTGSAGMLHPTRVDYRIESEQGAPLLTFRLDGWSSVAGLQTDFASTIERLDASGRVIERWTWSEPRPMQAGEFARVTVIPPPDGSDPIRGVITFNSIFDFRPGAESMTQFTEVGARSSPIPPSSLPPRMPASWSTAGWMVAGVLVAALVGVRVWRSRSAAP